MLPLPEKFIQHHHKDLKGYSFYNFDICIKISSSFIGSRFKHITEWHCINAMISFNYYSLLFKLQDVILISFTNLIGCDFYFLYKHCKINKKIFSAIHQQEGELEQEGMKFLLTFQSDYTFLKTI